MADGFAEAPPMIRRWCAATMSRRLDLPVALAAWLLGFAWMARTGDWTPLAVAQVAAALRLVASDAETRRLFALRPAAIVVGAGGAIVSIAGTYLLLVPIARTIPSFEAAAGGLYGVLQRPGYAPLALLPIILVVVLAEEVVWRGRILADDPRRPWAWRIAQSAIFAAIYGFAHATSGSALLVCVAFVFGGGWAFLRMVGGSIWAPFIAHALWDVAVLFVWPLA